MHNFLFMRSKLARAVLAVAVFGSVGFVGCRQTPAGTGGAGEDQGSPIGMGARSDTESFRSQAMDSSTSGTRMAGGLHGDEQEPFAGSREWARPDMTAYLQTGLYGQHWTQGLDTRESVQGDFGAKPDPQQQQQQPAQQQQPPQQ